ncbi:MAG: beta-galactosidase [Candidatus Omnitrophica bacterium]|nr:beta-galactosidase [Candidatus Omnitrophota bacterium]
MIKQEVSVEEKVISFDKKSMIINGKRVMLYGGEFHYFRVPHELWEDRLRKMKAAGLNLVATYIPWNFHEMKEGEFIWEGDRDLDKFVTLTEKYGFYLAIKPGPYICAEWDFGGFPDWLLGKDVKLREDDPEYLRLIGRYYKEIAGILRPHLVTKGGNIILFQIENEYDHLIAFTGIKRYKDGALRYHLKLLKMAREAGIDVPAFTVEGSFLRKSEIIDARTYYPNIPWIWLWEFDDFDKAIEASVAQQPKKPLMIMELETGWFAQFGKPLYQIEPEVTRAILRTVIAEGASVMSHFLFVGGTTFPYWNCKGDYGGIGTCTTYDFGHSPLREWGEVSPTKYHMARNTAQFLDSFEDVLFGSEKIEGAAKFIDSGNTVALVDRRKGAAKPDFSGTFENVKVTERAGKKGGFLMVRNLTDDTLRTQIEYLSPAGKKNKKLPSSGDLKLAPRSSFLFPIDVPIGDKGVVIKHSTCELLLKKEIGENAFVFLTGRPELRGETYIKCGPVKPAVIEGDFDVKRVKDGYIIGNENSGLRIIKIEGIFLVFLDDKTAAKIWDGEETVAISDYYYIEDLIADGRSIEINAQVKNGCNQLTRIFTAVRPRSVTINKEKAPFKYDKKTGSVIFKYDCAVEELPRITWLDSPRFISDLDEKEPGFDDSSWKTITMPKALEQAGLLKHGFIWYRQEFGLKGRPSECLVKIITNDMDRFYVYVNGEFIWRGIGSPCLDITGAARKGKNLLAVRYENAYHTKAHPHEGPIKKLSGIMQPVRIRGRAQGKSFNIVINKLLVRENAGGLLKGYHEPEIDENGWKISPSAKKYVFAKEMGELVWYRRRFKFLPRKGGTCALKLTIDHAFERCVIYLNGRALGKYESVGPQNDFYIPEPFLRAENTLAILVEGPGFHPVKGSGFVPPVLKDPRIGFYYAAKKVSARVSAY